VLFLTVNGLTFLGTVALSNFKAIMTRYADLMKQPEKIPNKNICNQEVMISLKDCEYGWKTGGKPAIKGINCELKGGDLMIVIGTVGSGKTTLLYSLMRESVHMAGRHDQNGTIAYVEQEPFIISSSIKENIILGRPYNHKRFLNALKVSQLDKDIKKMSKGADTVIGERGINISGGQKARISLARAVFSDADIFLLDDPLSAVDPEVANGIFNECIMGLKA
jgi:ABC-type bacteriocin/lantibiotic exporter with double-glycine peptidase domain